jgi:hypothetical protein
MPVEKPIYISLITGLFIDRLLPYEGNSMLDILAIRQRRNYRKAAVSYSEFPG